MLTQVLNFVYFRKNPKATANTINKMDVVATAPSATTLAPSASNPLKVVATISANAATTKIENNQVKIRKSLFPVSPMYCSIMYPMDLPLFFTEAYIAEKS